MPRDVFGARGPGASERPWEDVGLAKHCYQTVINTNEMVAGSMVVRVRVANDGHTCDVNIVNDTTGNGKLQNCVRTQFLATIRTPWATARTSPCR